MRFDDMTTEQKMEIYEYLKMSMSQKDIAKLTGISIENIKKTGKWLAAKGYTWVSARSNPPSKRNDIIRLLKAGETVPTVAKTLGIGVSYVSNVAYENNIVVKKDNVIQKKVYFGEFEQKWCEEFDKIRKYLLGRIVKVPDSIKQKKKCGHIPLRTIYNCDEWR